MKTEVAEGDRVQSNSCGIYTILKINGPEHLIRFDMGHTAVVTKDTANSGMIKDPLFPSVFGVGFIGVGEYVSRKGGKILTEYGTWSRMLSRCYYENDYHRKGNRTAYDDVIVDASWFNFQVFADWYLPRRKILDDHGILNSALDKEILAFTGKPKVYSPETCCVVPSEINSALINIENDRGGIMLCGLGYFIKQKNKKVSKHFSTIEEAIEERKIIKQIQLTNLAYKYSEVLEPKVYYRLCNWFNYE